MTRGIGGKVCMCGATTVTEAAISSHVAVLSPMLLACDGDTILIRMLGLHHLLSMHLGMFLWHYKRAPHLKVAVLATRS